jgi:quinol monooxygenase YgiN
MSAVVDPIVVVARWAVRSGSVDDVLALVAELREKSLAEPGCAGYEVFRSTEAPDTLLLVERYRDAASLEAHRASGHYRSLVVERILPMLADRRVELLRARDPA